MTAKIHMEPDSVREIIHFPEGYGEGQRWNLYVSMTDHEGNCIAQNSYRDIFALSSRVKGHPERMSHETRNENLLGIRKKETPVLQSMSSTGVICIKVSGTRSPQ